MESNAIITFVFNILSIWALQGIFGYIFIKFLTRGLKKGATALIEKTPDGTLTLIAGAAGGVAGGPAGASAAAGIAGPIENAIRNGLNNQDSAGEKSNKGKAKEVLSTALGMYAQSKAGNLNGFSENNNLPNANNTNNLGNSFVNSTANNKGKNKRKGNGVNENLHHEFVGNGNKRRRADLTNVFYNISNSNITMHVREHRTLTKPATLLEQKRYTHKKSGPELKQNSVNKSYSKKRKRKVKVPRVAAQNQVPDTQAKESATNGGTKKVPVYLKKVTPSTLRQERLNASKKKYNNNKNKKQNSSQSGKMNAKKEVITEEKRVGKKVNRANVKGKVRSKKFAKKPINSHRKHGQYSKKLTHPVTAKAFFVNKFNAKEGTLKNAYIKSTDTRNVLKEQRKFLKEQRKLVKAETKYEKASKKTNVLNAALTAAATTAVSALVMKHMSPEKYVVIQPKIDVTNVNQQQPSQPDYIVNKEYKFNKKYSLLKSNIVVKPHYTIKNDPYFNWEIIRNTYSNSKNESLSPKQKLTLAYAEKMYQDTQNRSNAVTSNGSTKEMENLYREIVKKYPSLTPQQVVGVGSEVSTKAKESEETKKRRAARMVESGRDESEERLEAFKTLVRKHADIKQRLDEYTSNQINFPEPISEERRKELFDLTEDFIKSNGSVEEIKDEIPKHLVKTVEDIYKDKTKTNEQKTTEIVETLVQAEWKKRNEEQALNHMANNPNGYAENQILIDPESKQKIEDELRANQEKQIKKLLAEQRERNIENYINSLPEEERNISRQEVASIIDKQELDKRIREAVSEVVPSVTIGRMTNDQISQEEKDTPEVKVELDERGKANISTSNQEASIEVEKKDHHYKIDRIDIEAIKRNMELFEQSKNGDIQPESTQEGEKNSRAEQSKKPQKMENKNRK